MLLIIHEVALPHTISTISLRIVAQAFQKWSNALINFTQGVSIHGSSSINTTFLPSGRDSRCFSSNENASRQLVGCVISFIPALASDLQNSAICAFFDWFSILCAEMQTDIQMLLLSDRFCPRGDVHILRQTPTCGSPKATIEFFVLFCDL